MISLLCPSRGRPELVNRMITTALETAQSEVEIMIYLNDDDEKLEEYRDTLSQKYYEIGPDRSPVYSWNLMAEKSRGDICFLISDDAQFQTNNWDQKIESAFDKYPNKIACVYPALKEINDSFYNAHYCLHKNWINTVGFFACPLFWWYFADVWTRNVALKLNRYHVVEDFQLSVVPVVRDALYQRRNLFSLRDREFFMLKSCHDYMQIDVDKLSAFMYNREYKKFELHPRDKVLLDHAAVKAGRGTPEHFKLYKNK
jgi:hypothetical protein